MKRIGKKLSVFAVIFLLALPVFAQIPTIDDMLDGVDQFSQSLASSLPFNSTLGLNWSDAYIGPLFGLPPHIGVGFSSGFTTIPLNGLNGLLGLVMPGIDLGNVTDLLDGVIPEDLSTYIGFPLPAYTLEARIGGFGIPFDIGVKYSFIEPQGLLDQYLPGFLPVNFNYMLAGADVRLALINPKVAPVKLSIGIGFNYLKGGISTTISGLDAVKFEFDDNDTSHILSVSSPEVGLSWETKTIDAKAHLSFPLVIVTPYVGVGVSYGWSKAGFEINSTVYVDGQPINIGYVDALDELGLSGVTSKGFSSIQMVEGFNFRAFGGISLDLFVIKLDTTLMYNISDKTIGAQIGIRLQL